MEKERMNEIEGYVDTLYGIKGKLVNMKVSIEG